MLAQSFLSAADLGITEPQLSALQKTLVLLETGKLAFAPEREISEVVDWEPKFSGRFNMRRWAAESKCGTICCIGGTASLIGGVVFENQPRNLYELFSPPSIPIQGWAAVTPAQAATALRSYLTCGNAKWSEAVSAKAARDTEG